MPIQVGASTASEVAAAFAAAAAAGDGKRLLALLAAEARLAIAQAWIDGNRADRDIAARQRDQLARALARLDAEDPLALDFEVSVGAAFKDAFAALRPETAAVEARELGTTAVIRYLSSSEDTRVTLLAILLEQRRGDWEVTAYSNSSLQPEPIEPHWPPRRGRS